MAACRALRFVLSRSLSRSRCSPGHRRLSAQSLAVTSQSDTGCSACLVTENRHEAVWRNCKRGRGGEGEGGGGEGEGGTGTGVIWAAVAFSLFGSSNEDQRTEAQRKEDDMILLLKKAKLSIHRGQLPAATSFLHQAVVLAHQTHNNQAIIYTYSQMANLAYVQGQLDSAEKLFKASMSFILAGGTPEDDNAVIEMSLKLATIYAEQNKVELAEHGFKFCTESLEAKLEKYKELQEDEKTEEQEVLRKDTHLLLGLCLDSRARYQASKLRLSQAGQDYRRALDICRQEQGETHPQTLVLMSDLATILDLQGSHDDALVLIQQAVALSQSAGHPEQHVLLGNLAGILLHTGRVEDSVRFYKQALDLARQSGDQEAVDRIQEGLQEVKKRNQEEKQEPAQ
ncbi:tetratricopeptide repeat protein 19, mitochondrial [Cololabis saira]|uniref:tetratricopeptide repeat protein 19, mitochondrial n=1 Tax=Cololabis saira TaxID=129043 RepID=UPI002AD3BB55|nr:tetratricopeptide repeat protein 19, mitochondrial [Cololabis saira]